MKCKKNLCIIWIMLHIYSSTITDIKLVWIMFKCYIWISGLQMWFYLLCLGDVLPQVYCVTNLRRNSKKSCINLILNVSVKVHVLQTDLLSFSVALKHKHAEGGLILASVAPVAPLQNKAHQPAVLLMGGKLSHVLQLELTNTHNWDASAVHVWLQRAQAY